jgi:hypothetical protein
MEKQSEADIATRLCGVFDVCEEEARKDTQEMIQLFLEKKTIIQD